MKIIRYIQVIEPSQLFHTIDGYTFRTITKNGEMALINWIEVWKDGNVVCEFRESNCNLFGDGVEGKRIKDL